ncbi:ATP-binding cassette domain-containing protein [Sphingomonas sp. J315]|uniref:ATP-binding cassette domain-containing protein n=1 Tax=Sphingomonas sp. J315 TaxID=2898433 RepID=UPI0021AE313E|nr:ATP-binding cassette domain-containing protein [Sphingomonas sp. J315]
MLEAIGLTKDFGTHRALDTLDLRVNQGEIVCLLGANGAGKTTTINLFLGFLEPSAGEARVDGVDVQADPVGTKRKLLYVPEQIALFGELTGVENLAYFAALSGIQERTTTFLRQCLAQAGLPRSGTGAARFGLFERHAAKSRPGARHRQASARSAAG